MKQFLHTAFAPLLCKKCLTVMAVLWAITAFVGPFGTYETLGLSARFLYWGKIVIAATIGYRMLYAAVVILASRLGRWQTDSVVGLLFSILFTPSVLWLRSGEAHGERSITPHWFEIFIVTLAVTLSVSWLKHLLHRSDGTRRQNPRILERLPKEVRGDLIRISAHDHYVDVVTSQGAHRLLMRFSDAINEADGTIGHLTHRSHWVVKSEVAGTEVANGKLHLRMRDGELIPVSRKFRPEVEQAGLI